MSNALALRIWFEKLLPSNATQHVTNILKFSLVNLQNAWRASYYFPVYEK